MFTWVMYAIFVMQPADSVHWRVADEIPFSNYVECYSYFSKNTASIIEGLKVDMERNFGPWGIKYDIKEIGCTIHNGKDPISDQKIPILYFNKTEKINI